VMRASGFAKDTSVVSSERRQAYPQSAILQIDMLLIAPATTQFIGCLFTPEKRTVVSCSYPQASQDQKLVTQRSLIYLERLAAMRSARQLGQL
jgi:hypothetical protein